MAAPIPNAPILISYRDEGNGKGAFFDHWTIQNHTGFPTVAVHGAAPGVTRYLSAYIATQIFHNLPQSPIDQTILRPVPIETTSYREGGLLIIPGMARDSDAKQPEFHRTRMVFEERIIKDALLRGRPIVAICAGSWKLWQTMGGRLEQVTDHNYNGGMPRVGVYGSITHNVQIHDVEVSADSLVQKAMGLGAERVDRIFSVNSVHWKAPDANTTPANVCVTAVAKKIPDSILKTRKGVLMSPQEGSVEAFETVHGAPVIGFGWHPEAYSWNDGNQHWLALQYMAQAGNAFQAKQEVNRELEEVVSQVAADDIDALPEVFKKLAI